MKKKVKVYTFQKKISFSAKLFPIFYRIERNFKKAPQTYF